MSKFRPLSYSRSARTRTAYIALGASILLWFALGAVQTHWVILALFIIPPSLVAWDLMKNDTAHFHMDDTHLTATAALALAAARRGADEHTLTVMT